MLKNVIILLLLIALTIKIAHADFGYGDFTHKVLVKLTNIEYLLGKVVANLK